MENEEKKAEITENTNENEEELREENAELEAGIVPSLTNTEIVTQVFLGLCDERHCFKSSS